MDINLPLNATIQATINKVTDTGLNLKLNQVLAAKVVDTQIMLDTLTVKINDKTLSLQAKLPVTLQPGQSLQLQVVKLLPTPEFKILSALLPKLAASGLPQSADLPLLKLVNNPMPANQSTTQNLNQLSVGQQLQATVINLSGEKLTVQLLPTTTSSAKQPLQLTLNTNQILTANENPAGSATKLNSTALTAGTPIALQVLKAGDTPTFALSSVTADSEQHILEALKQLLPAQGSPVPLLNQLQQAMPHLITDASVAETLKHLAQQILLNIPNKTLLNDPIQLKQAVSQSGLFLESKLFELLTGKSDLSLQDDFKLKLNKLIQLLNQELTSQAHDKSKETLEMLKESLQKAQGALAKLTLDQLNSLPKEESPKQAWTLELPFFNNKTADSVKIEIEQDKAGGSENQQKNWAVSITITPPELGTIHCKISCYDGSINTRFWSEASDTVNTINAHLDYLKQQFESKGLTTGFMEAHQGQLPQTDSIKTPVTNLLREKA